MPLYVPLYREENQIEIRPSVRLVLTTTIFVHNLLIITSTQITFFLNHAPTMLQYQDSCALHLKSMILYIKYSEKGALFTILYQYMLG